ncbi:MAG: hypothetical protein HYY37_02030 [Candidatus Aenigmarchaeota archaeon]|nr:hypothetical protein [Candidatus Aenigmarchaeota archaeon]
MSSKHGKRKFSEFRKDTEIAPKSIAAMKGMLSGMETKPTKIVIKEVKRGWKDKQS